jgi:Ca2+-dependent lipid-binding protein
VKANTADPVWNEDFSFPVRDQSKDVLHVLIKDSDLGALSADDPISRTKIPLSSLKLDQKDDRVITLDPCKSVKHGGEVRLWLELSNDAHVHW